MKKTQKHKKPPIWHLTLGLCAALIATGWYWSDLHGFYTEGIQAAAALMGL